MLLSSAIILEIVAESVASDALGRPKADGAVHGCRSDSVIFEDLKFYTNTFIALREFLYFQKYKESIVKIICLWL